MFPKEIWKLILWNFSLYEWNKIIPICKLFHSLFLENLQFRFKKFNQIDFKYRKYKIGSTHAKCIFYYGDFGPCEIHFWVDDDYLLSDEIIIFDKISPKERVISYFFCGYHVEIIDGEIVLNDDTNLDITNFENYRMMTKITVETCLLFIKYKSKNASILKRYTDIRGSKKELMDINDRISFINNQIDFK